MAHTKKTVARKIPLGAIHPSRLLAVPGKSKRTYTPRAAKTIHGRTMSAVMPTHVPLAGASTKKILRSNFFMEKRASPEFVPCPPCRQTDHAGSADHADKPRPCRLCRPCRLTDHAGSADHADHADKPRPCRLRRPCRQTSAMPTPPTMPTNLAHAGSADSADKPRPLSPVQPPFDGHIPASTHSPHLGFRAVQVYRP